MAAYDKLYGGSMEFLSDGGFGSLSRITTVSSEATSQASSHLILV